MEKNVPDTLYRIHTEATGEYRERAINIMAESFDGFTVHDTEGFWKGQPEKSMVLEYSGPAVGADTYMKIVYVAERIREANAQQAVCIQVVKLSANFSVTW